MWLMFGGYVAVVWRGCGCCLVGMRLMFKGNVAVVWRVFFKFKDWAFSQSKVSILSLVYYIYKGIMSINVNA